MAFSQPRLRTMLIAVNLLILLLPIGGVAVLRLYESELVRRAQAELVAQGAVLVADCRREFLRELAAPDAEDAAALRPLLPPSPTDIGDLQPAPLELDLAKDTVLPRAREAENTPLIPDPAAAAVGRRLEPLMRAAASVTLAGVRLVDQRGVVVATTQTEMGLSLANREEVRQALAGRMASVLRARVSDQPKPPLQSLSRGTRVRVFVAMPVLVGDRVRGAVVLSRTPIDIAKALYFNRAILIWSGGVMLLGVALVSTFLAMTIGRPIRALIRQSERAAKGEKGAITPLERPVTREVAQLSHAFATLARVLEERADYIRDFASHVSHEFKTPLASIRGAVELLHEHDAEMTTEERERFLRNLADDAQRLDRLVRRLLELARADTLKPGDEATDVGAALTALAARHAADGLVVTVRPPAPPVVARMAPDIFQTVFVNLLDNAHQHGATAVEISVEAAPSGAVILVHDNGPGVSPANAARIFTPFFTTARERGGSGLGLSIVRSLLAAHGGDIALAPANRGALFVVRLPN